MSEPDDDGCMTLIPAGTNAIRYGSVVQLAFPTEDDAIMFVEMMRSLDFVVEI